MNAAKFWVILILMTTFQLCHTAWSASATENQTVITGKSGQHTFLVRLTKCKFQRSHHKISGTHDNPLIDGRPIAGNPGYLPFEQIPSFAVVVDGKKWSVPDHLWRDCFNPIFRSEDDYRLKVSLSKNGNYLRIKMSGGDGADFYHVVWQLKSDGQDSRKLETDLDP